MKKILSLVAGACFLASCQQLPQQEAVYQVIPLPAQIEEVADAQPFVLNKSTRIVCNDQLSNEAELLQGYIEELTGHKLDIAQEASDNDIVLSASLTSDNSEAYTLTVDEKNITINGASPAGTFYGAMTLVKSIPQQLIKSDVVFPAVLITDEPRFAYRGAHFDPVRHFFEVDSVKNFIDMIALHNINTMHFHLTDDQGWRIEIKSRPLLTEVGSQRVGTCIGHDLESCDSIPYGGYYTQEQLRDLVDYAAKRHITIIPEVDLPGHMLGVLEAYPELGCTGGPYKVWTRWGISDDVLCAGNDSVYVLLDDVINEVMDIFPSPYIHIGGDECPKVRWKECPKCQAKIKALGLKKDENSSAEAKLQSYVMDRVAKTITARGRRVIGWDEFMEGGIPDPASTVVMSWRGVKFARDAAKQGIDAILTPTSYCYFDYMQSVGDSTEITLPYATYLPIEKVYSLEPVDPELTPEEAKHILGAQANTWTEYIPTYTYYQYKLLPRLAAISEVQWTQPGIKDFDNFMERLPQLEHHYDAAGYNYYGKGKSIDVLKTDPELRDKTFK